MNKNSKITIFGGRGLLGSAIQRVLEKQNYTNIDSPTSKQTNLINKEETEMYFKTNQPDFVFMTAGLVGGILGNKTRPADFLYQNTIMILNVLETIKNFSQKTKLLYTGSTCIYPKENPQPINESRLLQGPLEESNKGYALAKITGITACQLYKQQYQMNTICAMPTNMYGLNDNYDLENGHFLAAVIKKLLINKEKVTFWGTGTPRREALFSEDCADALIYLMNNYSNKEIVNIGTNLDYSIKDFIETTAELTGFKGKIEWDSTKPDGTILKKTDITKLKSIYPEFNPRSFEEGLKEILSNEEELKRIKLLIEM